MEPRCAPTRLVADRYSESGDAASISLRVRDRRPVFRDAVFARHCVDFLRALAAMTGTPIYAYCLMPNHVHLLLGVPLVTSMPDFLRRWRSLCSREWQRRSGQAALWQQSVFDHPVRGDVDLLRVGSYILMNPVRSGLVEAVEDYPLCGSFEWDLTLWNRHAGGAVCGTARDVGGEANVCRPGDSGNRV